MERFATKTGMLPEQVWDENDLPKVHLQLGRPTGSAMPLIWAHAEYIRLLRSVADGKVFDLIPEVASRYQGIVRAAGRLRSWKPTHQPRTIRKGTLLRIQAPDEFVLHWSVDNWKTVNDTNSTRTILGVEFVDIMTHKNQTNPIRFTFFWRSKSTWEGKDYSIAIEDDGNSKPSDEGFN